MQALGFEKLRWPWPSWVSSTALPSRRAARRALTYRVTELRKALMAEIDGIKPDFVTP